MLRVIHSASVASFAFRRLELLESKFALHRLLNQVRDDSRLFALSIARTVMPHARRCVQGKELAEQKLVPHRDFYNVRKVRCEGGGQVVSSSQQFRVVWITFCRGAASTCHRSIRTYITPRA